jgi:hypothetical protein
MKQVKVHIPAHIYAEIDYYVQQTQDEISGLGRIVTDEDGTMRVSKIYLIKQENSGSTTDLDEDAVSTLLYESRNDEGEMTFWWHSHNSMKAFWSGTDHATIKDLGKNGYVVATVFNHDRDHQTAYFQGADGFKPEIFIDHVPTSFHPMHLQSEEDQWKKNVAACVSKKTYNSHWRGNYESSYERGMEWNQFTKTWGWPVGHTKQKKETKSKGKQVSLLGEDAGLNTAGAALKVEDLYDLVGSREASQWEMLWQEANDFNIFQVEDEDVLQFYIRNDGNYERGTLEAYNIIADKEFEESQKAGV